MKIKNNNLRFYYFDYLRIFCSFWLILIHVCAQYNDHLDINTYEFKIAYYYHGFSRFSVPNFFMISGAVFLQKDLSLKIIFNKYIKRIFIHLLLWPIIFGFIKISKFIKGKIKLNNKDFYYNIKVNINLENINIKTIIIQVIKGPYHI